MNRSQVIKRRLLGAGVLAVFTGAGLLLAGRISTARAGAPEGDAGAVTASTPEEGVIRMAPETLELAQLQIEEAGFQEIRDRLEVTGVVEPDLSAVVRVTPQVGGKVLSIRPNLGDAVRSGEVLATLASSELAQAQAEYHHARHRRERAAKNLDRQRRLARLGAFGRPRVEEARSRAVAAHGAVEVARGELAGARSQVLEARSKLAALQGEVASGEADAARVKSDIAEAAAAVRVAQAAVSQARSALQVARNRFLRYEILLKEELVSRQDWEQAQAEVRKSQSDVESAEANRSRAETRVAAERAALQAAQARVAASRARVSQAEAEIATATARQAECEARLQAATKSGEIAAQSLSREEAVFEGAYLTSKEIVEAEADLREADHDLEAAETKVRLLGGSPGGGNTVVVTAPLSGRVTERRVTLGEMVTPENSLFTLTDLRSVWVQLSVYQKDLARVLPGQEVTITSDAAPGRRFVGKVAHVGDALDEATRAVKVRCVIRNAENLLRPSVFVRGVIARQATDRRLVVPSEAVQDLDGKAVVFVPTGATGEFRPQPVSLGEKRAGRVEIRAGLRAGERVVVGNALLVKAQALKGAAGE